MNRLEIKREVLGTYGGKCWCCGEEQIEFLSIDHIDGIKPKGAPRGGTALYSWLKSKEYPLGFRTMCLNCNLAIGFYGSCPHELDWTPKERANRMKDLDKLRASDKPIKVTAPPVPKLDESFEFFRALCRLEPELWTLYQDAQTYDDEAKRKPHFCANQVWYHSFKPELTYLVGWNARQKDVPLLKSQRAYSVAYQTIYSKLPPCRDCWCV